jgi:hypothetical protein
MLIRFFRSSQTGLLFIVPFVALVWFIPFAFHPAESFIEIQKHPMPLYEWMASGISKLPFIAQLFISWLLISVQAIYLNQLIIKFEIFPRISFLPALFFVTLSVLFPEIEKIQPQLFVNLILLVVLDKTFSMYKNPEPMREVFDSSFLLGIATLLQGSSIAFYIFLLLAFITLLPFYWRVWVISFIGFTLPFYFISVYFYWMEQLGLFWNLKIHASFSLVKFLPLHLSIQQIFVLILIALLLLFAVRSVSKHFYKNVIRTRKYFQLIFTLLFTGIISLFLAETFSLQSIIPLLIPISIIVAYYFLQIKRIVLAEFFYALLVVLIILARIT